jgi:microcystin-dependent protein
MDGTNIIIIVLLVVIILIILDHDCSNSNKLDRIEGFNNELSNEALQNIGSIYKKDTLAVSRLSVTESFNLLPPGSIIAYNKNTAPQGWTICNGTSGSPDLRGRFILGTGPGPGLTNRVLNQKGGAENHTLTLGEMPKHTHGLRVWHANFKHKGSATEGSTKDDSDGAFTLTTHPTGESKPHNNMSPFYVLTYIMKL